ncbi:hypothetical protein Patl1_04806 [Pistacia atlantica]|uniref:Uncharacterized protein n=1 Tax=Pistacia atlantica TaxID=434234 RepID=A0ACC1BSI7_9ROSI|nr:hypothetical protein Patl1_04806 [Pistacia atlantica]
MPLSLYFLRLSGLQPNHVLNPILFPPSTMVEFNHLPSTFEANYRETPAKKISCSFSYFNSFRLQPVGAFRINVDVGEIPGFCKCHKSKIGIDSMEIQTFDEGPLDAFYDSIDSVYNEDYKEKERRRKIGLANKGNVPWNKGRKHTVETRARIRQRTIEALRDPKVRRKMAEHPHSHSDESKARIGSALRHSWAKRLRWKRLGEEFILSWSENIAKAAKDGWSDRQELDWDSYDKIKQEMAVQQLQRAADKAKAKEMAKINAVKAAVARAEKAALAKAEKMARIAEKRKEREEKAKRRREIKSKARRKSEKSGELSVPQELKLKRRLTKIHKKKSITGPVATQGDMVRMHIQALEKLDINLIKKEKQQREVSLADQIQAAKNKRAQSMAKDVLAGLSTIHRFSVRSEN